MGAVLCGGNSERFGQPKAIAAVANGLLLAQVGIRALRSAGVDPVVAIGGSYSSQLGVPTIADRWPGSGPLAGVASALLYTTQTHVLAIPCDLPLLRAKHIGSLLQVLGASPAPDSAVVATLDGVPQPSLGIWPTAWARELVTKLRSGDRRLHELLTMGQCQDCPLPDSALLDADTPEALTDLLQRSSEVDKC